MDATFFFKGRDFLQDNVCTIYIYTLHYMSLYYKLFDRSGLHMYSPNSQVTDINLTGRQRLKDDHLSLSLRFFSLGMGRNDKGLPFFYQFIGLNPLPLCS